MNKEEEIKKGMERLAADCIELQGIARKCSPIDKERIECMTSRKTTCFECSRTNGMCEPYKRSINFDSDAKAVELHIIIQVRSNIRKWCDCVGLDYAKLEKEQSNK